MDWNSAQPLLSSPMDASRKIIHIDMDAFFASVEQRETPAYKGLPLVVGGKSARGVVAAASYEARTFGIHSAMSMRQALQRCPNLVVVKPRKELYKQVSDQIHAIFRHYTDLIEPLSLDEAFLDVTENKMNNPSGTRIAEEIRQKIRHTTGLTASAGVSFNKFLAKIASDLNKPDGLSVITPEQAPTFIAQLPVEKFFGVGPVTAGRMRHLGIATGADLLQWSLGDLVRAFGKAGRSYYDVVRNEDRRPVTPNRPRHSVGTEDTFEQDLHDREIMRRQLLQIAYAVELAIRTTGYLGRTLTLKVKFADFQQITRSKTVDHPITQAREMMALAMRLFEPIEIPAIGVRLLGLTVSTPCEAEDLGGQQLSLPLFSAPSPD
ncbi:DNA polymerase IV [Magnetofaba australis]|uniref:DNA polymerase IV n=1 Tax=Magnetofaba australis IT-1 TaxID=1434232 RepID=A0A1Y2K997_9PROT|nr:DNA polymerase IV [Magnetofaba australis]OSM07312.1 putative Nucleotidyltransferase/DNA polymerase [Magnetofaba australis IT-1]